MRFKEFANLPILDSILVSKDGQVVEVLHEGKWVSGKFDHNIRIDQPTHGAGQTHAHVFGRKGIELGVVNIDGTSSHGAKCRLSATDSEALRARGFNIRSGNVVEWVTIFGTQPQILFG